MSTSFQLPLGEVWRHFLPRNSLWSSLQPSPPSGWLAVLFPPSHQPLGHGRNSCPPLSSSTSSSPPPASPRRGQPSQPKIATANKEMSSLGLLSSAGAHFFQLGFKLRNTSVCLISARCQHFCSACSGATGRLVNSMGKTSRNNSISFFFKSPSLGIREHFQLTFSWRLQGQEVRMEVEALQRLPAIPTLSPTHTRKGAACASNREDGA